MIDQNHIICHINNPVFHHINFCSVDEYVCYQNDMITNNIITKHFIESACIAKWQPCNSWYYICLIVSLSIVVSLCQYNVWTE